MWPWAPGPRTESPEACPGAPERINELDVLGVRCQVHAPSDEEPTIPSPGPETPARAGQSHPTPSFTSGHASTPWSVRTYAVALPAVSHSRRSRKRYPVSRASAGMRTLAR
ncbi:hypothetical protein SCANM63S_03048 [Streptomyces canarius]